MPTGRNATSPDAAFFPRLLDPSNSEAVRVGDAALTHSDLAHTSAAVAEAVGPMPRIAVWAVPALETIVAVVGALRAGVTVVPLNPRAGDAELTHCLSDAAPTAVLHPPSAELPSSVRARRCLPVDLHGRGVPHVAGERDPEAPAFIIYTSGTTGRPKGAVLPRRALLSNIDALATAWQWTADDTVVHALPLFHIHGLLIGTVAPLRLGGRVHHLGQWSSTALAQALGAGGTMLFAVPTMYHRLSAELESSSELARALATARLLVSGSASLSMADHRAVEQTTGQRIVERYGLTETLINCAVRAGGERRPGSVGPALDGVDVLVVDAAGDEIAAHGPEDIGEIVVRGPNLFSGYLNRPDATAAAMRGGWFATGDIGWQDDDGYFRIIGRTSTDLIKTGGYKVGAGEVEAALLEHPAVAEVAVAGEPDEDLGESIAAWVVTEPGHAPTADELIEHVAAILAPYKRPRRIRFLAELPRNDMGKVMKTRLGGGP